MQASGQLPQLGDGAGGLLRRLAQQALKIAVAAPCQLGPSHAERDRDADHALPGAIVEVALHPPSSGVARLDNVGLRHSNLLRARKDLGVDALVLQGLSGSRARGVDATLVVTQGGIVNDSAHRASPRSINVTVDVRRRRAPRLVCLRDRRPSG